MAGLNIRRAGVLLHATSLPSAYGIGDLGRGACDFADFLSQAKASCWQLLPLTPTLPIGGHSPYSSLSAFAGNTMLISPDLLQREDLLATADLATLPPFPDGLVDFSAVIPFKERILERAWDTFSRARKGEDAFKAFCAEHASWLDDFALFKVLRNRYKDKAWNTWDAEVRDRKTDALERVRREVSGLIEREKYYQYLFYTQWSALKRCCNEKGIQLIGDIPIYVNYDSADVWANPHLFKLDQQKRPTHVAGVPPDYFSSTGQLWGNPVYRWDMLRERKFDWWIQRMAHTLSLFDLVRVDHFRGLVAFWEVPAGERTAVNGRWVDVPAAEFFTALKGRFPELPIIAEDLGIITDDVREIMDRFGFPGMRVLLFAFGEDNPRHPYLPHNYTPVSVAYTGTHDNNTVRGWIRREAGAEEKRRLFRYLGREVGSDLLSTELIRLLMMSVAGTVIIPMQDLLGLGEEARMNRPGVARGNWTWRLRKGQLTAHAAGAFAEMASLYGRA
ncbi:MAG: 4-alpha-glucanotransferase [Candidatus Aureabacteria bacterium]|nr:4-alpha-glucanotransferase [Candidatus Auribacterota bacterium]